MWIIAEGAMRKCCLWAGYYEVLTLALQIGVDRRVEKLPRPLSRFLFFLIFYVLSF